MSRIFTNSERQLFEQLCTLKQSSILQMMRHFLKSKYTNIISTPSYIIAIGDIPVGLVAHADTIFHDSPSEFFYDQEKNVIWSPDGLGADDRAGIFAIMKIIALGQRPHIIITTDEECGAIGANKIIRKLKTFPAPLKFLIQLDRRNHEDAVYYDCINDAFEDFITSFGFTTAWGSFSDIAILAPAWKIAAVNLSIGYQNEHSVIEHLFVDSLFNTITKVRNILNTVTTDKSIPIFEYIERNWNNEWYNNNTSYTDTWHHLKENETHCQFCGEVDKKENLLPLYWHAANSTDTIFYICNDCYAHSMKDIEWCSKCNKGYFLTQHDIETISNRSTWVCKHCQTEVNSSDCMGRENSNTI